MSSPVLPRLSISGRSLPMKRAVCILGVFFCGFLHSLLAATISAQQVAPVAPGIHRLAQNPLLLKPLSPAQHAIAAAVLHQVPIPHEVQAVMPVPPSSLEHAHWQAPVGIHYGATFDFSRVPYQGS